MDISAAAQSFAKAHPIYVFGAGIILGPIWPKIINWFLTSGVDKAIPKILAFQKFYLRKIGVTDSQVKAIESDEAIALERAAADVKNDAETPEQPAGEPGGPK